MTTITKPVIRFKHLLELYLAGTLDLEDVIATEGKFARHVELHPNYVYADDLFKDGSKTKQFIMLKP
jgi:hypothetical protein